MILAKFVTSVSASWLTRLLALQAIL